MTNSILILLPVISVALGALVSLALEPFLKDENKHQVLPWVSLSFVILAFVSLFVTPDGVYYQVYAMNATQKLFAFAILFSLFLGIGGMQWTLAREKFPGGEAYGLLMLASVGALLMAMSVDLLALFISMELAAFPIYALVGLRRKDKRGNEGTFKYFVTGAVFSAIFLYGMSLFYGASGSTSFDAAVFENRTILLALGLLLVLIGLFFKAGAAPTHFWVADVYTGAPIAVTSFMAAVVKIGALAAIANLWIAMDADATIRKLVVFVALLSVVIGAFSGLAQKSVRRILAFSAVMNAGFMLLALLVQKENSSEFFTGALQMFLVTYAIASAGALTGVAYLASPNDENETLDSLQGLGKAHPVCGLSIVICLASLAGLPPLAGFLAKFELFTGLFASGYGCIASVVFFLSLIAAIYYLRIAYVLFAGNKESQIKEDSLDSASWILKAGVSLAAIAMILFAVFPNWICF